MHILEMEVSLEMVGSGSGMISTAMINEDCRAISSRSESCNRDVRVDSLLQYG
jgi:hypothetical protein